MTNLQPYPETSCSIPNKNLPQARATNRTLPIHRR